MNKNFKVIIPIFTVILIVETIFITSMPNEKVNANGNISNSFLPLVLNEKPPMGPTPIPKIQITGIVRLEDGTGISGVNILSRETGTENCEGAAVAVTDEDGKFDTLISCPYGHDETMMVCAAAEEYRFEENGTYWRTYGYCPSNHAEFVAYPIEVTPMVEPEDQ